MPTLVPFELRDVNGNLQPGIDLSASGVVQVSVAGANMTNRAGAAPVSVGGGAYVYTLDATEVPSSPGQFTLVLITIAGYESQIVRADFGNDLSAAAINAAVWNNGGGGLTQPGASAITWADVLTLAPDVASVPTDGQNTILAYVNSALDLASWGTNTRIRMARIYMAAHFGVTVGMGAASGPITQESGGGLMEQYALNTDSHAMATTAYGRQYLGLLRSSAARAWVVI